MKKTRLVNVTFVGLALGILAGCAALPRDLAHSRAVEAWTKSDVREIPATTPVAIGTERHQAAYAQLLEEIRGRDGADLVFLGDSITWMWKAPPGQVVWKEYYADRSVLNAGIGGSMTENIIWQIQNGYADGYRAKLAVLMIGTNNSRRDTGAEIAEGVRGILREWFKRQPQSKMLVLAIFPRGETPADPRRQICEQANEIIRTFHDGKSVFYMDINEAYLDEKGVLSREIMPDLLHPESEIGYRIWAEGIEAFVKESLGE
jgi:beta-glucosidase